LSFHVQQNLDGIDGRELWLDSRLPARFISQSYIITRPTTQNAKNNAPLSNTGFGATVSSPG
jgi:hypothetical protein